MLAVVGADGFIGSHVVRAALASGMGVRAVCVRDPWRLAGLPVEIQRVDAPWWTADPAPWMEGAAAAALLAYEPPPGERTGPAAERHEHAVNAAAVERQSAAAAAAGARPILGSSADVYGPEHDAPVAEDAPARPSGPYGAAKLEAEEAVLAQGGVALRLGTVYGPGELSHRAIPRFLTAYRDGDLPTVHGDGSDVRDYVHVGDVAGTFVRAAASAPGPLLANVGSGIGLSTLDVLHAAAAAARVEPEASFVPTTRPSSRLVLDIARAAAALALRPRTDLVTALEEELAWLRTAPSPAAGR